MKDRFVPLLQNLKDFFSFGRDVFGMKQEDENTLGQGTFHSFSDEQRKDESGIMSILCKVIAIFES